MSDTQLIEFANQNNIDFKLLKAIIAVEAGGSGFDLSTGALKIRFEVHLALDDNPTLSRWFLLGKPRYLEHFTKFPSFSKKWSPVHTGKQDDEFKALLIAAHTIGHDAWKYASFGSGQILAKFHYEKLGFDSAIAMYSYMAQSSDKDTEVWLRLIKSSPGYLIPLQRNDLRTFVTNYNGTAQVDLYLERITKEMYKL